MQLIPGANTACNTLPPGRKPQLPLHAGLGLSFKVQNNCTTYSYSYKSLCVQALSSVSRHQATHNSPLLSDSMTSYPCCSAAHQMAQHRMLLLHPQHQSRNPLPAKL